MSFRNQTPSGRRHAAPPNSPPVTRPPQERRLPKRNEYALKADRPKATARLSGFSAEAFNFSEKSNPFFYPGLKYPDPRLDAPIVPLTQEALTQFTHRNRRRLPSQSERLSTFSEEAPSDEGDPFVYRGLEYRDPRLNDSIVPLTQKALTNFTNSAMSAPLAAYSPVYEGNHRPPLSYAPSGSSNLLPDMTTKQGTLLTDQTNSSAYWEGSTLQAGKNSRFPDIQSRNGSTSHFGGISPPKHPGYHTRARTLRGQPEQPERKINSSRTRKDSGFGFSDDYTSNVKQTTLGQSSFYGRG